MAATGVVDILSSSVNGGDDLVVVTTGGIFFAEPLDRDRPPRIDPDPCPSTREKL